MSSALHMWSRNILKFVSSKFQKPVENMASIDALQRLEARASQAESLISVLKAEVSELQKVANFCKQNIETVNVKRFEEIKYENEKLKREIEEWKNRLISAEKKIGGQFIQCSPVDGIDQPKNQVTKAGSSDEVKKEKVVETKKKEKAKPAEKEEKKVEKKTPGATTAAGDDLPVDVRRLDIRIGKILNVKKHPGADSLYVEEVDFGEEKPRTVVSGLVKFVPIEQMENRMVVGLCNLKPAKMRGVTSEAMVLCASTPDKVEVLIPPEGSQPGDRVAVEGYSGEPDSVLNPKKKIFETVAPDLRTDSQRVATYKGVPLSVQGKGVITSESLTEVQIK